MSIHCNDVGIDRRLGEYWERVFCCMMAERGKMFTPMQIGRSTSVAAFSKTNGKWNRFTMPDVTVWTAPGEHHELKHKTTTKYGSFGLELYRLDALVAFARETAQSVRYTIHDHHGLRNDKTNRLQDWCSADVLTLANAEHQCHWGDSYVSGVRKRVQILYWNIRWFSPLFPED